MSKVINISGLKPNKQYKISIRGTTSDGRKTAWSKNYTITTPSDSATNKPKPPTISTAGPQKIIFTHDNKDTSESYLSDSLKLYELYSNTTNTTVGATKIATIPAHKPSSGFDTVSTIGVDAQILSNSRYFYVKAINYSGQDSLASDLTSSVSITAFSSAYISSLTADKIATGTLSANTAISVGSTTPIVLKSNETSPYGQIYIGTGSYNNSNTSFYVDSTGKFSLKDKLYFDGTSLNVSGNITGSTITGSSFKTDDSANYIEVKQESVDPGNGTPISIGKITFKLDTYLAGGMYVVDTGEADAPLMLIQAPRGSSNGDLTEIRLYGGTDSATTDGHINLIAGNINFSVDNVNGVIKASGNTALDTTGFRNIYVSSTAGNPTPSSPQNGDIKLEW